MAWLGAAAPYLQAAGAAVGVASTIAQGNTAEAMAQIEARQQREHALADVAESQITAREERKRAAFLTSRVRALTGASGTGQDSPNVVNAMAEIDEQGSYNALAALYSGATSARSRNLAANMALAQGKNRKNQSRASGFTTILNSASGWYG